MEAIACALAGRDQGAVGLGCRGLARVGGAASRDGGVRAQDTKREDWFSGDSRGRAAAIGHCLGGAGSLEAEEHTLGTISMLQGLLLSCLLGPLVSDKMPCISWR